MLLLVVPMDPQFLPEGALLIGGAFGLGVAINALFARRWGRALKAAGAAVACVGVAIALGKWTHKPAVQPKGPPAAVAPAGVAPAGE
jgi:hypothetical protein